MSDQQKIADLEARIAELERAASKARVELLMLRHAVIISGTCFIQIYGVFVETSLSEAEPLVRRKLECLAENLNELVSLDLCELP